MLRPIGLVLLLTVIAAGCAGSRGDKGAAEGSEAPAKTATSESADGKGRSKTGSDKDPAAKTPATATRAGAPEPGTCLEPVTAFMSSGHLMPALVSCDSPHGGEVVAVYDTPAGLDDYPAVTQELRGLDQESAACAGDGKSIGAFGEFAGDNRLKVKGSAASDQAGDAWLVSSLSATLLLPSPSRWEAGEHWVVCAAVLQHSDEALNQYSGSAQGVLKPGDLESVFAWCKRQLDPNDRRSFIVVSCDEPHSHEQVASFSVGDAGDPYPGEEELGSVVGSICPDLVSTATGGRYRDAAKDFDLSWTYPVESTWQSGDRTARCYVVGVENESRGTVGSGTAEVVTNRS